MDNPFSIIASDLEKELLIEVRSGEWRLEKVLVHAKTLSAEVEAAVSSSPLPEKVDRDAISKLMAQVHLEFWKHPNKC